jgi:hypothetical protein
VRALLAAAAALGAAAAAACPAGAQAGGGLRGPEAFASIGDRTARSLALFAEAGKVFQHPRCRNCHPAGDRPLQGDEGRLHHPAVRRGPDGLGVPGLRCTACHQEANYDPAGLPGARGWHLAPVSMALEGRSLPEICAQLKDADRNGGRELADIATHVTNDPLIRWTWTPGGRRTPVPATPETFAALVRAWIDTGAACPPR